jgi:hypothetical protein
MKHGLILCLVVIIASLSCFKPERDNEYDPQNPCKAHVAGIVYGYDDRSIEGANVALILDGEIKYEDDTDVSGKFQLNDIDPSVYVVEIKAPGYIPVTRIDSMWAGREIDSASFHLKELYFDFEDVPINTMEPYLFNIVIGSWAVVDVPGQNHAYAGFQDTMDDEAITYLDLEFKDYYIDVMINLLGSSTGYPGAHLILKYQDPGNFYWVGIGHDYIKLYKRENWNFITLYEDHGVNFLYDHWYQLQVEVSGNTFAVHVPGVTQFAAGDDGWPTGSIGLYLLNWDGFGYVTNAIFDDLYIDTRPQ